MESEDGALLPDEQSAPPELSEQAVLRCVPGLRALLLRITQNIELTNDLAQEVLLSVILSVRAGRIREPSALPAYIHQTARNAAHMQRRQRATVAIEEIPESELRFEERPRTPLEYCEEAELRRLVRQVLDELPTQRDRDLVAGFYVQNLDKSELMQRFGLDKDQFDRVISRARGRMRDLLRAKMNDDGRALRGAGPSGISNEAGPGRSQ